MIFAFAKSNLYDYGVLVLAHCASAFVSKTIFYWAHTNDFCVTEDWFGINDLDLQSHVVPSGVVSTSLSLSTLMFCVLFHLFRFLCTRFDFFRLGNSASRFLFVLTPFSECVRRPCKSMVTTSNEMAG